MTPTGEGKWPASRVFADFPPSGAGQAIGLYGGSFDPPHAGHAQVARIALSRLGLDAMWWLVSPGNPLKDTAGLAPLAARMAGAARIASHPRIRISGVEARYRIRYTADLVDLVSIRRPGVRFVWVMGSDNLATFHDWRRWQAIAARIPIAVINRPGATLLSPLFARAAIAMAPYRVRDPDIAGLVRMDPPAWAFIAAPRTGESSTRLRSAGRNPLR